MLILFLKADQLGLFETPVRVAGSVDKHGHVRKPYVRVQKVKAKESKKAAPAPKRGESLDLFAVQHEGVAEPVEHTRAPEASPRALPIVEHQTKRRLLRGVIMRDASKEEAAAIDPYTFRKENGWFIREKYLVDGALPAVAEVAPEMAAAPVEPAAPQTPGGIDYSLPFNEIPIPAFGVPDGISKTERRRLNAEAIGLLDKSDLTDDDRAVLAQYSGLGGVGDSLNEFYTSPEVAAGMWKALRGLGVTGGNVLEPSCATGVYMATAPAGVRVTGVELDPTSAKISGILHGAAHETRNASLERFATSDERQFDAVIGNAPFGLRGEHIRDDKPELKTAEQYFLDTALDKTKPGGVVAMIVPTGVMDGKNNRSFRERLLRKSEFLGAQRMPNTAFEHAHTAVTADIVYLRKRPDDVAGALGTVDQDTLKTLGAWDDEFLAGGYFKGRGAGNVFGTQEAGWRAKAGIGDDIMVTGSMAGVPAEIAAFEQTEAPEPVTMDAILAALPDEAARERAVGASATLPYAAAKVGDTKQIDGVTYVLQGDPPRWHRVDEVVDATMVATASDLADEIERLMDGGTADRPQLEKDIRAFIEAHGIPAKNKELLLAAKADRRLHRLIGAVGLNGRLSDVVTGRGVQRESNFELTAQALSLEHESRDFDAGELADRLGRDLEEVEDHLMADAAYAYTGHGRWTTMDTYLTGELWPKLDAARAAQDENIPQQILAEKFATQERLLLEAIDPQSLEDVDIKMNSAFIPPDILAAWLNWKNHESPEANQWTRDLKPVDITYEQGVYTITGGNEYGDQKILDKYLNRTGVRKDDMPAVDRMNEDFKEWIASSRYRDQVEDLYNRKFRGFKPVAFSDAPIDIPGMANVDQIKDYQWPGLRWAMATGKGIVAADVGLGKTARGLMLARMAQLQGNAKKPMIVVPKSVLANWAAEVDKWFPGANTLVIGGTFSRDKDGELRGKDDSPAERNRKLHDLTQNDYDFILCAESVYQEVDLSPALKKQYAEDDFWVQRGDQLGNMGDKRAKKVREQYKQNIAGRDREKRTDAIYFEDLGVDMVIRDEGHREKNLWAARNRFGETPKFLGGQGESQRAYDFYLKSKFIRDRNDGRNVYMLTATPTKNSPLEVYSMLSHIAPEAFERIGIRNSEEFLDRFCVFDRDRIYTLEGQFEEALVTSGFKNLGELREIMSRYIDRKTAEDVGLELPRRDDRMHYLDMSSEQSAEYQKLRERLAESRNSDEATGDAHIFAIMSDMAKVALDPSLYDPDAYKAAVSPKYEAVAKNASEMSKDGGQIIFAQYIGAHEKIAAALEASGVPRSEIAIVNSKVANSAVKRQNISDKFNAGKIRYVIGNSTMEEGMNLQRLTADIHHLDLPWEPASMQQRNGRGLRQGNLNESVRIHTYISKGTFDGYRYQSMMRKKDWQDLLWNGGDSVENLLREGSVSHDDLAVMVAEDPESAARDLAQNKSLAAARYEADRSAEASADFSRYQTLKGNYAVLQNKKSASARRLQARIEKARDVLKANPYFKAHGALDATGAVLIHPATGDMIAPEQGFEVPKDVIKGGGQFVVTAVSPGKRPQVSVRRYGVPDARNMIVSAEDFAKAKPFDYDKAAETAEIDRKLADQAEASVEAVDHPSKLRGLPAEVLGKHYGTIQDKLKTALKEYKWSAPSYGAGVGFVNAEGRGEFRPSYGARDAGMDVMLPTADHRAAAEEAWISAERGKQFQNDYVSSGRKHSSSRPVLKQKYADEKGSYYGHETNPWSTIGNDIFGPEFEEEAREKFLRGQYEAARHAGNFADAAKAIAPTVDYQYGRTTWPKRALAILWAKAKREGVLDRPMKEAATETTKHGRVAPIFPPEVLRTSDYGGGGGTVHDVLSGVAAHHGHSDLAAAVHTSRVRDREEAVKAIERLASLNSDHKWDAIRHLVDKYELGDVTPEEIGINHYDFDDDISLRENLERETGRATA